MAGVRGISLLEVLLVKLLLLGTGFVLRDVVRDATADTMSRANSAILQASADRAGGHFDAMSRGGLPSRAEIIGDGARGFGEFSLVASHPLAITLENQGTIRARKPFCGD